MISTARVPVVVSAHRAGSEWLREKIERSCGVDLSGWSRRDKHFWPRDLEREGVALFVLHKHPLAWLLSIEDFWNRWASNARYRWQRARGSPQWAISERWASDLLFYLHAYDRWTAAIDEGWRGSVYRYRDVLEDPEPFVEAVGGVLGVPAVDLARVEEDARTGSQAGGSFDRRDYYLEEGWRDHYSRDEVEELIRWIDEANGWPTLYRLGYSRAGFRGRSR